MRRYRAASAAIALSLAGLTADASAETLRIGVIAPEEGSFAILGEQVRLALDAFADTQSAAMDVEIVEAPEPCDETSDGADAASSMVESGVSAVIGLFCPETILGAMPALAASNVPAITVSVRAPIIMEDALSREWPLFRLAPSAQGEAETIASTIADRWADEPFALIEDGTIYGRDLVETIRLELAEIGITPSYIDNFRPAEELQFGLVRRLANAGVTHVFVGGDRSDVAVIARDANEADLDLTFMGGDAMLAARGDVPLAEGVMAVIAERNAGFEADSENDASERTVPVSDAARAIERELQRRGLQDAQATDGYHLTAFAAGEILAQALADSDSSGEPLIDALKSGRFDTALGGVRFGADQARDDDPYRLVVWRGGQFVPIDTQRGRDAPAAGQ